jgi:hypothetical protein
MTRMPNTKTRVLGGNPQTGPFYVEGAMPGDVLVVRIKKLRLNRATAISDDSLTLHLAAESGSSSVWPLSRTRKRGFGSG